MTRHSTNPISQQLYDLTATRVFPVVQFTSDYSRIADINPNHPRMVAINPSKLSGLERQDSNRNRFGAKQSQATNE